MTQFFNNFKKPYFWPIWGAKKFISENPALSRTTSCAFLTPFQNIEKTNPIPRKRSDRRTKARADPN